MALSLADLLIISFTFLLSMHESCGHLERNDDDQIKVSEFNIKPGGDVQSTEGKLDGVTCKFVFAAQGGTNEKWSMALSRNNELTDYSCSIERPGMRSYLFFTQFSMEISGAAITNHEIHSQPDVPMDPREYTVSDVKNTVSHVEGVFNSQLSMIEVQAKRPRQEL